MPPRPGPVADAGQLASPARASGAVHAPLRLGDGLRLAGLAGRGLLWLAGPGRLGVRFALAGRGLLWLAGPGRLGVRFAHGHFSFRFITGAT